MMLVHRIGVGGGICLRMCNNHRIGIRRSVIVKSRTNRRTEWYSMNGMVRIRGTICETMGRNMGLANGVWNYVATEIGSNVASADFTLLDLK